MSEKKCVRSHSSPVLCHIKTHLSAFVFDTRPAMTRFPDEVWARICELAPHDHRQFSPTAVAFREGLTKEGRKGPNKMLGLLLCGQCDLCHQYRAMSWYYFHSGSFRRDGCCMRCASFMAVLAVRLQQANDP